MIRSWTALRVLVVLLGMTAALGADEPHPFTIHDMLAMERISDHQVSPDGDLIAFVLRTTDLEANKGRTDLWLIGAGGKNLRQLTTHPDADMNPRWTPDGKSILFISTRSGSSQVWRISVAGGEAEQITKLPLDVGCLVVSPDGKQIAVSMEVFPGESVDETKKQLDKKAKEKTTGQLYDRLFVRHWDTWKDGRRAHVFVRKLDAADSDFVDVMKDMDADAPSKPFGGPEEIAFSPDGKEILFSARDVGEKEAWSTDLDLYAAPVDGSQKPRCLTEANEALDTAPAFSPDGKTLAYLAMEKAGYEADRVRIVLKSWPDGEPKTLTELWDRSASEINWSSDGKTIYTTADNVGQHSLFAIDTVDGKDKVVLWEGRIGGPQVSGGRIVYSMNHLNGPSELYSIKPDGTGVERITHINDERVAATKMGEAEQFSFAGWNGEKVYGYVVKPIDFSADKKYPVAFLIHGGPQGSFGNDFHYRWNPQAYAAAGYAAIMIDFHGSTGYGQAFCDAIRDDWGGKPLEDLRLGLEAAIKRYSWMDGERVAALGASYGGYMINWIAGKWPDRFKCLVSHDGNIDEQMAYFDTEELWFPEWEHHGTPWDNPEGYQKHNPVNLVKHWQAPMLIIHGGLDYRVVDTQGLSSFTACQRRGIPSKFLYFPDENHWVLKPANSILWHETVLAWLDEWTKK